MKDTILVKPEKIRLTNLLNEVAEGKIKIPVFQRDFVWRTKQMIELFDSIFKGYPIGSLLLWQPNDAYDVHNKIGPYEIIPNEASGAIKSVSYVLDGFQRITTLFGVLAKPGTLWQD